MNKLKKCLAVLVCMAMVLGVVPTASFASEGEASVQAGSYMNWKQTEGPWADYIMGSGSAKVRTYGCTTVSLAMIAVRLGCENEGSFNPGIFVDRLNSVGGYMKDGNMVTSKKYDVIPNLSSIKDYYFNNNESNEYRIGIIDQNLKQGYAVMIKILKTNGGSHYVAADYVSNNELYILDPGGANGNIKNKYSGAKEMIDDAYVYGKNSKPAFLDTHTEVPHNGVPSVHTHSWTTVRDVQHPHSEYRECSCGAKEYTGRNFPQSTCPVCYPIGSVVLTRSVDKTGGSAVFRRGNASNATSYTLQLYQDGGLYATYNMNAVEQRVSGLSAGNYTVRLIIRNADTGEEKSVSCDGFRIYNTYTVCYDANGGSGEPSPQSKIQDQPLTLSYTAPKKKGYNFLGWASSKTAVSPSYESGGRFNRNTNITLYAVWEPEVYDIHFDLDGGKGDIRDQKLTYGDTMRMPNSVINDGCYLRGWAKNYGASEPEYRLGMDYTFEADTTLYAVWGDNSWSGGTATSFAGGSGTEDDPYRISNAAELAYLAEKVNSQTEWPKYEYYELTGNISLGNTEWVPIGLCDNRYQYFYGSFDGNGYTVSDLRITKAYAGFIGIFGYASGSKFKNVTVSGDINGFTIDEGYYGGVGALVGFCIGSYAAIDSCNAAYVNISGVVIDGRSGEIGCLVGYSEADLNDCSVNSCFISYENENVVGDNFDVVDIGQLAGKIAGDVNNCRVVSSDSLMNITYRGRVLSCGGMAGDVGGAITNSYVSAAQLSSAEIVILNEANGSSRMAIGGLVGIHSAGDVLNCFVNFTAESDSIKVKMDLLKDIGSNYIGGLIGNNDGSVSNCQYRGHSITINCVRGLEQDTQEVGGLMGLWRGKYEDEAKIERCLVEVDGSISVTGSEALVGGAIGGDYSYDYSDAEKTINNLIVIADEIKSNNRDSKVGDIVGYIYRGTTDKCKNNHIIESLKLTTTGTKLETSETKRPMSQLESASFQQRVFGAPYQSLDYFDENPDAVWVIKEGSLPMLYIECLNAVGVGKVEHGTISVDKSQAVDGEIVTVSAVPDSGYVLNKIYVNGAEIVGTTFEVSGDSSVYATFAEITPEYSATVQAADNATGSLENVDADSAELASAVFLMADGSGGIKALDGAEIRVNAEAAREYAVDAIYVNGEELAGTSFIIDRDSVVTLDVASTSTAVTAVTNDAEEVDYCYATLGGSVSGQGDGIVKYIRYWKASEPENVTLTEAETGSGDYSVRVDGLMPETTYMFQMTEYGDVKTFTTPEAPDISLDGGDAGAGEKLTATTYKRLSSSYRFYVETSRPIEGAFVIVAAYDGNGGLLAAESQECDGSSSYTLDIPVVPDIKRAKVFVWDSLSSMTPLGEEETVEIV